MMRGNRDSLICTEQKQEPDPFLGGQQADVVVASKMTFQMIGQGAK
jgi:hypothetical protein